MGLVSIEYKKKLLNNVNKSGVGSPWVIII